MIGLPLPWPDPSIVIRHIRSGIANYSRARTRVTDHPRPFVARRQKEERSSKHVPALYIDHGPRTAVPSRSKFLLGSKIDSGFTMRALVVLSEWNEFVRAERRLPTTLPIFRIAAHHCSLLAANVTRQSLIRECCARATNIGKLASAGGAGNTRPLEPLSALGAAKRGSAATARVSLRPGLPAGNSSRGLSPSPNALAARVPHEAD
jgi:hypothetical protein